ncbi:aldehyde dehydrogenase family protein [Nakamurella antarctica]|uniref:Aldehyde dehydrogenase family protein n=1 Tax=Nakamurella antarctica TaxID=1902245 RepID=A0A3G8ZKK8_9ACTN|nr:aldehyde dehydrogenase family protein [Nakamurella antarctica]AZI57317.1 aldehyde dehydrogenase family protein [Nakamurella antarctica]
MDIADTTAAFAELDNQLAAVASCEKVWAATSVRRRRELLLAVRDLVARDAELWAQTAAGLKRLPSRSPLVGEEWTSGPYALITALTTLAESAAALEAGRSPVDEYKFSRAPGGRTAVDILPHQVFDHLLFSGFSAQVWMPPGVTQQQVREQAGLALRDPVQTHGVGVVLGAGNITSIAPLDVLSELYASNRVVVLKLNPVMDAMLPVYQRVFAPLIELGVLFITTGGADVGQHLVQHHLIDHVHITGSAATHDAIVWGTDAADVAARKSAHNPVLSKPITSELGGVSPIIVLPGTWSKADLRFQAEHVATMRLHNNGYNCIAGQVVLMAESWPQKEEFVEQIRLALRRTPDRDDYYPGSGRRVQAARSAYPEAETISGVTLINDPADTEYLRQQETFAPVLGIIELPGADFLQTAVRSANDDFVGTLGVNIIAHPRTLAALGDRFENALAELRYGCIAVNAWTGVGFLNAAAAWGAFPGHTLADVQSGIGAVHNALLLKDPERTVVRGPFRPSPRSILQGEWSISPRPPWFVTNKTAARTGELLTAFAASPSWAKLPGIFASALRG